MLLERFLANPELTRYQLHLKLGQLETLAAEVFALVVFICDNLFQLKRERTSSRLKIAAASAIRFFAITMRLPMELQMIVCNRCFGSVKEGILRRESEAAFKSLARILLS